MPAETYEQLLDRAAASYGIELGYWDIWGNYHEATADSKRSLLRTLGIDATSQETLEHSMAARTRAEWTRLAPPAVVAKATPTAELLLQFPTEWLGEHAVATLSREDGQT